ncbi:Putative adhesin [Caldanaerobius fijiensis DSM 17918]|uniref:Putative adhesin n=1 Tax=Caldanaerobius fijiensis DSM 17918 TaxID=1121256 RepID=A0A1M5C2A7_9THEO|nr:Putative adhesin [Caldanaerobius fijiensis DSM 17918]
MTFFLCYNIMEVEVAFIKRAGTISCALSLLAIGVLGLIAQTGKFTFTTRIGPYIIPAFLVLVGLDIIITARRLDSGSVNYGLIIFTFLVIMIFGQFYAGNITSKINIDGTQSFTGHRVYKEFSKNISPSGDIKTVKIENAFGNITLTRTDKKEISVNASISSRSNFKPEEVISIREENSQVVISTRRIYDDISVNYSIKLPDNMGVEVINKVGSVEFNNVIATSIKVDNKFDDITIKDSRGDIMLDNSHGNVKLNNIAGSIDIDNAYGGVSIDYNIFSKKDTKFIKVSNSFGNINLSGAYYDDCNIEASTTYGRVRADYLSVNRHSDNISDEITYKAGNGALKIVLKNRHGNISIE